MGLLVITEQLLHPSEVKEVPLWVGEVCTPDLAREGNMVVKLLKCAGDPLSCLAGTSHRQEQGQTT